MSCNVVLIHQHFRWMYCLHFYSKRVNHVSSQKDLKSQMNLWNILLSHPCLDRYPNCMFSQTYNKIYKNVLFWNVHVLWICNILKYSPFEKVLYLMYSVFRKSDIRLSFHSLLISNFQSLSLFMPLLWITSSSEKWINLKLWRNLPHLTLLPIKG
jgi:hypothetical protein